MVQIHSPRFMRAVRQAAATNPQSARLVAGKISKGQYYEFDRFRRGIELGRTVSYPQAITLVRGGRDVYTLNKEHPYRLARSVCHASRGMLHWRSNPFRALPPRRDTPSVR